MLIVVFSCSGLRDRGCAPRGHGEHGTDLLRWVKDLRPRVHLRRVCAQERREGSEENRRRPFRTDQ